MEKQGNTFIVDADDFCEGNSGFETLRSIKHQVPDFKISLFTIVGKCSIEFLEKMSELDWIRLYPHGLYHKTSRECENWSYNESLEYLRMCEIFGVYRECFKAPGWQISDGMYKALDEKGWVVADQAYNNERRPKDLEAYILDSPNKLHFHIGHMGGHNVNEIGFYKDYLMSLNKHKFEFI
ncbi:hypothetical protein KAU11_07715 [Candidatus Babeliales bacterium]|nr:hypothetical protein [Candidatus Babeliales bacterium]